MSETLCFPLTGPFLAARRESLMSVSRFSSVKWRHQRVTSFVTSSFCGLSPNCCLTNYHTASWSLMVSYVFVSHFQKQNPNLQSCSLAPFWERAACRMLWLSMTSNGFILLAEVRFGQVGMNTSGHDSVQKQSLFMDVNI